MSTERDRISKLPIWAQRIYQRDQQDIRALQAKAFEVAPEGAYDIAVTHYGDPDRGMPRDTTLEYRLRETEQGRRIGRITIHHKGDHIEVYGNGELTTDTLRIEPRSSNRLVLTLVPHDERLNS
jgi:hypothetical protein